MLKVNIIRIIEIISLNFIKVCKKLFEFIKTKMLEFVKCEKMFVIFFSTFYTVTWLVGGTIGLEGQCFDSGKKVVNV